MMGTFRSDVRWLAAVLASESNEPHDWWWVGWVVRNRVENRRFPGSYESVALQRRQFSFFNWTENLDLSSDLIFWQSCHPSGNYDIPYSLGSRIFHAYECAKEIASAAKWSNPWHPKVLYYYSPMSMEPRGVEPGWWQGEIAETLFAPGIDPERFTFGRVGA